MIHYLYTDQIQLNISKCPLKLFFKSLFLNSTSSIYAIAAFVLIRQFVPKIYSSLIKKPNCLVDLFFKPFLRVNFKFKEKYF